MISLKTMKVFLICCIIELLCFSTMASNSDINLADFKTNSDSLQARMQSYFQDINAFNAMYPQEKVYLHFDNTAYFLEETIWSGSGGTKDFYTICGIGKEECGLLHNGDS